MNTQDFLRAFNQSRNGCDHFIRHPLGRKLIYTDGVEECFEAGLYWLSDIVATECVEPILTANKTMGFLYVVAKDGKADLRLELEDDVVTWSKHIHMTDLPDGTWNFFLGNDGDGQIRMILPNEY